MIFKHPIQAIAVALSLVLMSNSNIALAQTTTSPSSQEGGYVGFTAGVTRANIDFSNTPGTSFDDQGTGFSVYAGAMLTKQVGIELFYADLGSYELNATSAGIPYTVDVAGYGVAARFLTVPDPSGLQGFARIGVDLGEPDASCREEGGCAGSVSFEGGSPILLGIGAGLNVGNAKFTTGVDLYGAGATMAYVGMHLSLAPPNQP